MDLKEKSEEILDPDNLMDKWWVAAVIATFSIALWLRYRPEQGMQYLQALDPYMIFRMSQQLALGGNMPQLDFLRYFPYPTPTYTLNQGDIIFPAVLYWLGPQFFLNYLEWSQFYSALMGALSAVMMYFLASEIWDRTAGVSASFFLAVIAGAMHRTSAGFFDKEPIGTFFMMTSMYFFVRAWRRNERISGIASGLAFAFFTISWGGSQMLWLLYPLVVGFVIFLNRDVHSITKAYTPTILIGGLVASVINPSRFWITDDLFVANLGLLAVLWIRVIFEQYELVDEDYYGYIVPSISVLGLSMIMLSPLYSDFIASKVSSVLNKVNQGSGGDVIAGTVAENTPASLGQLIGQLGAGSAIQINQWLGMMANVIGTWPLAFVGVSLMGTGVLILITRRFGYLKEEITRGTFYKIFTGVFLFWIISFSYFFQSSVLVAVMPSILLVVGGMIFLYMMEDFGEELTLDLNWYTVLPFFWALTNILGAVAKSRLVFLATFPVAISAGYMFARAIQNFEGFDYSQIDPENAKQIKFGTLAVVLLLVASVNFASGYASSSGLGGSPNALWMDNLDYMENNTDEGAVMLSWWDYGYYFESIGRRAAAADGGNLRYYSNDKFGKTNYPIADFLTSKTPENHTELLEKHSVDYIILDSTMIGKYQAVSQIAHRDNSEFDSMRTASTNDLQSAFGEGTATFSPDRIPNINIYASLEAGEDRVNWDGAPILESQVGRGRVDCVLTDQGKREFNVSEDNTAVLPSAYFHRPVQRGETTEVCLAEHPFRNFERGSQTGRASMVIVPKDLADTTLVRLYLMNAEDIDLAEPVPEGSNGYVRMWEVDQE